MKLVKWQAVTVGVVLFMILLLIVLMKLPLRLVFAEKMVEMGITDINGASISGGRVWVSNEKLPGIAEVVYRWCPMRGFTSWCVDVENPLISVNAVLSVGSDRLKVTRGDLRRFSSSLLGPTASLVELSLAGDIKELVISSYDCPMQNVDRMTLTLNTEQVKVLGSLLGPHQIEAEQGDAGIDIRVSGDAMTALVKLSNGDYDASGELLATGGIASMARTLMKSLGDDRYGWEIKGKLPC